MKMTKRTANLVLFIVAVLWGLGFIFTKTALEANVTAGFANFTRGLIFVVLVLIFFYKKVIRITFTDFKIGLIAGLLNLGGVTAQTIGMQYTTPSNNAFITSTYIVFIPLVAWIIYKKSLKIRHFISITFCLAGMAILTGIIEEGINVNPGDIYTLIAAISFACSIAYISYGAKEADPTLIAFMLALVQTVGGFVHFLVADGGQLTNVTWKIAIIPLLYLGVICGFATQTAQVAAQRYTSATSAGLIMMLEGPFGSIFSIIFGFDLFGFNIVIGGTLIMIGLVLSEIDFKKAKGNLIKKGENLGS